MSVTNFTDRRYLCGILLAMLCAGSIWAQTTGLELIDLRHRPAEQLIPLLVPLVGERGAVTGQGFKLMVRGDAALQRQVRQALQAFDVPARRLMISVRQVEDVQQSRVEIGGTAVLRPGQSVVAGSVQRRDSQANDQMEQRVQGLEGAPAFISWGEQRVWSGAVVNLTPGGTVINPVVQPVGAQTGFYVLPRVLGDEVQLEIAPQREAFVGEGADKSRHAMVTQARGRLGEWLDLGGTSADSAGQESFWIGIRRNNSGERLRIQIKVEEIK